MWAPLQPGWREGSKKLTGSLLTPRGGGHVDSLFGIRVGVCPEVAGGTASVACPPLWWYCVQRACIALCFCFQQLVFDPGSSEVAAEFPPISLYLLGPELAPAVRAHSYFQSRTISLHFVPGGEVCPGASKGSQVPTCLRTAQEVLLESSFKSKVLLCGQVRARK